MRPLVRTSQESARPHPQPDRAAGAARAASRVSALAEDIRHRAYGLNTPASPHFDFAAAEADGSLVRTELTLGRRIRAHLPKGALAVTLTDNRHTMISVRRDQRRGPRYAVRLHHMFADADPIVCRALARYIGANDADASRVLGAFIDAQQHRVRPFGRATQAPILEPRGRHFDLQDIFDDLNRRYFGSSIDARITWGQRCGKPRRRNSIKMGSYSVEERLIRVHRSLDRAFVPRYFVEWIVYHEMLHQVHRACVVNGRRQFHTPAFLTDEASFEHYAMARAWERAHLDEILTY